MTPKERETVLRHPFALPSYATRMERDVAQRIHRTMRQEDPPHETVSAAAKGKVYNYVRLKSCATANDLVRHTGMSKSTCDRALYALVEDGRLRRFKAPNDVRLWIYEPVSI